MIYPALAILLTQANIPTQWSLLTGPRVQRELKLSALQIRRVGDIMRQAELELSRRRVIGGTVNARAIGHSGLVMEIAAPNLTAFGQSLDSSKRLRAKQLSIQSSLPEWYQYPGVADA